MCNDKIKSVLPQVRCRTLLKYWVQIKLSFLSEKVTICFGPERLLSCFTWTYILCFAPTFSYYANQKKTLELNPRHPLVKELKKRVETDKEDQTTKDLAVVLMETATLRSGYNLKDTALFAERIERMLRLSMDISLEEKVGLHILILY